jgi:hypothetical protein
VGVIARRLHLVIEYDTEGINIPAEALLKVRYERVPGGVDMHSVLTKPTYTLFVFTHRLLHHLSAKKAVFFSKKSGMLAAPVTKERR